MVNWQLRNLIKYPGKKNVYLIGPCFIRIKLQRENLDLKSITMIDPVTGWLKITQYDYTKEMNLVETTWLIRYLRPMEITYDQGSEFIGNEFIKSLIEK